MSDHHRRMIRYSLQHMMFLEEQIAELDRDVVAPIHQAGLDEAWQLIQTVPGIQDRSAASILAETGADMKQISDSQGFEFLGGTLSGQQPERGQEQEQSHDRRESLAARRTHRMRLGRQRPPRTVFSKISSGV